MRFALRITRKDATQVSLSDWLALWGKGTGGLKTPGYSKTVLRTETQRLRRPSLNSCIFNRLGTGTCRRHISQHAQVWSCSLFCCSHGQPYSGNNFIQRPENPRINLHTLSKKRINFHRNCSPARRTVSQLPGVFRPSDSRPRASQSARLTRVTLTSYNSCAECIK